MKAVFLYSQHNPKMNLQQITPSIYHDKQNNKFYRLNIMPSCTAFVNQDVQRRQVMTLTVYDINFFIINQLYDKRVINKNSLPVCMQSLQWKILELKEGKSTQSQEYSFEKSKIFDFLERKVQILEKYIEQHNPLERLKLIKPQKSISSDTITLLKHQLHSDLINQFVKERYNITENRKRAPDMQEQTQALKPKPSKNNKKPQQKAIERPKNQPTLFSAWVKK